MLFIFCFHSSWHSLRCVSWYVHLSFSVCLRCLAALLLTLLAFHCKMRPSRDHEGAAGVPTPTGPPLPPLPLPQIPIPFPPPPPHPSWSLEAAERERPPRGASTSQKATVTVPYYALPQWCCLLKRVHAMRRDRTSLQGRRNWLDDFFLSILGWREDMRGTKFLLPPTPNTTSQLKIITKAACKALGFVRPPHPRPHLSLRRTLTEPLFQRHSCGNKKHVLFLVKVAGCYLGNADAKNYTLRYWS